MNRAIAYQNTKYISEKLEQDIKELFVSDKNRDWLQTMSKFHHYSLNNSLFIVLQKLDVIMIAGYTSWKKILIDRIKK